MARVGAGIKVIADVTEDTGRKDLAASSSDSETTTSGLMRVRLLLVELKGAVS